MAYDLNTEKGIIVYDSFEYTGSNFSVAVRVTVDDLQYWRDRAMFISKTEPMLQPAFDLMKNSNYLDYLDSDLPIGNYLEEI